MGFFSFPGDDFFKLSFYPWNHHSSSQKITNQGTLPISREGNVPTERHTITMWSQHKRRLTGRKIHFPPFIPLSIHIQVNNNYLFFNNIKKNICQGFPRSMSSQFSWHVCKALTSLQSQAEKEERMASPGWVLWEREQPVAKQNLTMKRMGSQNSYILTKEHF